MRLAIFAAILLAVSTGVPAHADTIYYYTGTNFTSVGGSYSTSQTLTGQFTLTSPLADNLNSVQVFPTAFSFTDGVFTYTPGNAANSYFYFSTNATGAITAWSIAFFNNPYTYAMTLNSGGINNQSPGDNVGGPLGFGESFIAGTFSTTPPATTPEPSSLALLGTGLACMGGLLKRRLT